MCYFRGLEDGMCWNLELGGRREAPYRGRRAGKRHDDEIRILTFFMR